MQLRIRSRKIREYVAEKMIVKSEKSVDLLLGLLVFMNWYAHLSRHNDRLLQSRS